MPLFNQDFLLVIARRKITPDDLDKTFAAESSSIAIKTEIDSCIAENGG
jgi:hypothetical protein